ncbi:MAG: hypothetical protein CBHOC_2298 [uncultured Caballeronia sp.]|nr:MAG: hypothetical protein CBHOC_2298 [uncultured Caballeronia sp.]
MHSTKAISAVERLKTRTDNAHYAAVAMPGGVYLVERTAAGSTRLSEPMPMDEFIAFVNAREPAKPRKVSKLDLAMEEQIGRSGGRPQKKSPAKGDQ